MLYLIVLLSLYVPKFVAHPVRTSGVGDYLSVADFNNDGYPDIVAGSEKQAVAPQIFYNDSNFQFTLSVTLENNYAITVNVADLNGDSRIDVVSGTRVYNDITAYINTDSGWTILPIEPQFWGDAQTYPPELKDLDDNGYPDIITIGWNSGVVAIYWNEGNLEFTKDSLTQIGTRAYGGDNVADLDNDGDFDFLVYSNQGIYWFENLGSRSFLVHEIEGASAAASWDGSVTTADLDNDGYLDVIIAGRHNDYSGIGGWYHNNGDKTFGPRNSLPNSYDPLIVQTADIDLDGDNDIFVTCWYHSLLIEYENLGNGIFSEPMIVNAPGNKKEGLIITYFNNDPLPDILYAGGWSGGIYWLENQGSPFPPGDVNADSLVNQLDFEYLANYLYFSGPAPNPYLSGDVNGDCCVNDEDLVKLSAYLNGRVSTLTGCH